MRSSIRPKIPNVYMPIYVCFILTNIQIQFVETQIYGWQVLYQSLRKHIKRILTALRVNRIETNRLFVHENEKGRSNIQR